MAQNPLLTCWQKTDYNTQIEATPEEIFILGPILGSSSTNSRYIPLLLLLLWAVSRHIADISTRIDQNANYVLMLS
jgi:hypothetical protein